MKFTLSAKKACRLLLGTAMLLTALCLAACAPTQAPTPSTPKDAAGGIPGYKRTTPEAANLAKVGQERLERGRYLLAVDAFRAALTYNPGPALESRVRLGLAQAYEGARQRAMAVDQLRHMPAKGSDPEALVKAALLLGELERKLGQWAQAEATLRRVLDNPNRPLSDAERKKALSTLADTQADLGHYGQATGTILEIAAMQGGQMSMGMRDRLGEVSGRASAAELEAQLGKPRPPALNALLLLSLAKAQLREGRLEEATSTAAQVATLTKDPDMQAKVKAVQKDIMQARMVNPVAVGAILPLSGPWAQPGREVLAALELGLGLYETTTGNAPVLYIADSKGKALESVTAVDKLVDQHKVMAIIGPMGAAASLAAARQAQLRQVPLISLARVDGVVRAGDYVFQNSLTPSRQMDGLLHEAVDLRGLKRFAVLAPDNSYGRGFASLLRNGVVARGGSLVRVVYFDPTAKDYTPYVKKLVQLPAKKFRPGEKDAPQPKIDFQALLIPDGPQAVAMAASQLRYFDVTGVLLMGTDLWHDSRLLELASRDVQGAVFPGLFNASASGDPLVKKFVNEFTSAMGRVPTLLEAQGYDAALVLRHLISQPQPPRTRPAMRHALLEVKDLPGVCGTLSITPQRIFNEAVTIFTVKGKIFRPVQEQDRVLPEAMADPNAPVDPAASGDAAGTGGPEAKPAPPAAMQPAGESHPSQ
ncbi:MAG: ABC transporter substrate-binding protein [Desulfarculaceae bacterium]|nr:ABC transporter substrate-binding protein [Desulfarculaceae bacterium]MCF8073419.1 ABC transporter substrate-binding protein [Desulfarculaceae bacterium]MCF8100434.1 ABC transporter substrate-binding protein [Desulfarculaceae bacterium]MCF8115830.1 ABC transporter substrate-binding protein [Desulfarculaceae bacterium]